MTVKEIAEFLLTLPEDIQNREPKFELSINLPNGKKWQAQAPIAGFEHQLEDAVLTPSGVQPKSSTQDFYNIYRAEVSAGISDESEEMERYNPERCSVILKEGILVFVLQEGTMSEETLCGLANSSNLNSLHAPLNKESVLAWIELRYSQLAHSLLKAWHLKLLPHDIGFAKQLIEDIQVNKLSILDNNQQRAFELMEMVKLTLTGNQFQGDSHDTASFPRTIEGKYFFLLGLLMEAIRVKDLPSDCAFLTGIECLLTGTANPLTSDEECLLESIKGINGSSSSLTISR